VSGNTSAGTGAGGACPLCNSGAFAPADCAALAAQLVAAARNPVGALSATCASAGDALALTLLRDQTVAVCARSDLRVLERVPGSISSARYSQCTRCGVLRCSAGMVCTRDALPAPCPAGSNCPDGVAPLPCPAGSFCPTGVARPVACRALAAGSCGGGGAAREVVWVPLLVALALSAAARLLVGAREAWRAARAATLPAPKAGSGSFAVSVATAAAGSASPAQAPRLGVRLSFNALSLATRGVTRLDALTGAVLPGRVMAILGGSGAGKTTLLNVLLCKEAPSGGSVSAVAMPLSAAAPEARSGAADAAAAGVPLGAGELRRVLGFVPQTDVQIGRAHV
jgi:hypothetical protein